MKTCKVCKIAKSVESFHRAKTNADGRDNRCKSCKSKVAREERKNNYFTSYCRTKKSECKRKGIRFDLSPEYLSELWTGVCPISGTTLSHNNEGRGSTISAHLDRFDPALGYVEGNVAWISGRMNRIKYDATVEELKAIVEWMESVTTSRKA